MSKATTMDIILNIIFIAALFSSIYFLKSVNPDSSKIKQILLISVLLSCVSNFFIFFDAGVLTPEVILALFVTIISHLVVITMMKLYPEGGVYDFILDVVFSIIYFSLIYIILILLFYLIMTAFRFLIKLTWKLIFKRNKLEKGPQIST